MSYWSRRSRKRREDRPSVDAFTASLAKLPRPISPTLQRHHFARVEDRREYHPLAEFRPPLVVTGRPAQVSAKRTFTKPYKSGGFVTGVPKKVKFDEPNKVLMCVRRKERKEVLHALKKVGRGKSGARRRRNPFSSVSC